MGRRPERTLRHLLPRDHVTLSGKGCRVVPDLSFQVLAIDGQLIARTCHKGFSPVASFTTGLQSQIKSMAGLETHPSRSSIKRARH